jgi:hypothetical protein
MVSLSTEEKMAATKKNNLLDFYWLKQWAQVVCPSKAVFSLCWK